MNQLYRLFFVIIAFATLSGCTDTHTKGALDAKIIHYRVEYLDKVAGSVPTNILPDRMTLVLADNKALNTIEGFLGQFSLSYMADLRKNRVVTMLKIFDKRYYHNGKSGELPVGISPMENMFLELEENSFKMLDFDTRKYILHLPGQKEKELFGTMDLEIKNPNNTTPYREVPDVLLQFYTELSVLKMNMIAEQFEEREVEKTVFKIPENYKEISRPAMEKLLAELFK